VGGDEKEPRGFWLTLPGILSAVAALVTAVTGLILGLNGLGQSDKKGPEHQTQATTVEPPRPLTADDIAGAWSGRVRQGPGKLFELQLDIAKGCGLKETCGSISRSDPNCFGDISLKRIAGERYEFSVDHFSAASARACMPGAGELLMRHGDDALLYTTSYDLSIRGILHPPR
jgi:hypothetical protein